MEVECFLQNLGDAGKVFRERASFDEFDTEKLTQWFEEQSVAVGKFYISRPE